MAVDVNNKSEEIEEIDKVSGEVIEEKEAEEKEAVTKSQSVMKEVWDWVKTIVVAIVCAVFITQFVIVNARVPSASMETTIMTGDRLIANRLSYKFSDPKRYDIVVFKFPDDESVLYIKRIIGLLAKRLQSEITKFILMTVQHLLIHLSSTNLWLQRMLHTMFLMTVIL